MDNLLNKRSIALVDSIIIFFLFVSVLIFESLKTLSKIFAYGIFKKEVFDPIIYEKIFSGILDNITPNSENIRAALNNLDFHIQYFNYLLNNKNYFIKDELTYLDFLAAANFSVLDYLGLLNLKSYENIREWYFKLKSRPSFRTLLKDQIVGLNPHENYKNMDI